jgi:hypothetical protein
VPNEYVHKTTTAEVLLTGWRATGQDTFAVTASWPAEHFFYESVRGFHDPLLVAETVRQTVPLLSHVAYDVPFGHRQSWSRFHYSLDLFALATGGTPTEVELRVTCTDITRRGTVLAGLSMQIELLADGIPLGTAGTTFLNHPPKIYQRLRGSHADSAWGTAEAAPVPRPVPPHQVGRRSEADVVLAPAGPRPSDSRLRVDTRHPVLFDHPLDHVPGMLLLEAARQAGTAVAGHGPVIATSLDAVFTRYVELNAPCWIHAEPAPAAANGSRRVLTSAQQNDDRAFSATVGFESLAAL